MRRQEADVNIERSEKVGVGSWGWGCRLTLSTVQCVRMKPIVYEAVWVNELTLPGFTMNDTPEIFSVWPSRLHRNGRPLTVLVKRLV